MRALLLLFAFPLLSYGQAWSGIIDPSRAIDWSGAGVTGGIPARNTICSNVSAGASLSTINAAISGCTSGQAVKLAAGSYSLGGTIAMKSGVTLRGAGADQTVLTFSATSSSNCSGGGSDAPICIGGTGYSSAGFGSAPGPLGYDASKSRAISGTGGSSGSYPQGATVLNLASAPTGLSVGDTLFLFQNDDTTAQASTALFVEGDCTVSWDGSGDSYATSQQQIVKVANISGSDVTITPGLYGPNWRTSQTPTAYWWTSGTISGAGVEDLTVTRGGSNFAANIAFFLAADSWVKGVLSTGSSGRSQIRLVSSRHLTIVDSYTDGNTASGALSYGIEFYSASDSLIQNNIVNQTTAIMMQQGTVGNVVSYNYVVGGQTGIHNHQAGDSLNLIEGNASYIFRADASHGTNNLITWFRNWASGAGPNSAIDVMAMNRYQNIIGNVLGTTGITNTYLCNGSTAFVCTSTGASGHGSALRTGYPYVDPVLTFQRCGSVLNYETNVFDTSMFWGNWDAANSASRFQSSEVPSGISPYANAVPGSTILPASFYLSAKPVSWWGTPYGMPPWPANGPDVSSGNISNAGGHANKIPSQLCFENTTSPSTFNAATCYTGSSTASGSSIGSNTKLSGRSVIR